MPILNWIGKDAVVRHHKDVPFRVLKKTKSASLGENSQNLVVHGDNLEGLKALMPYYYGKVKCIYIDPPYNTGNENWVYNDRVNSPKIQKWLGKVVGKDAEDLCRHDKWLCMMYPRLKLLRDMLREDGIILVSIDDNEHSGLKILMDDIFSERNHVTSFIWNKKITGGYDSSTVNVVHEYILAYVRNDKYKEKSIIKMSGGTTYPNHDEVSGKSFKWDSLWTVSHGYTKNCDYPITMPDGTDVYPWMCHKLGEEVKMKARWFWNQEKYDRDKAQLLFKKGKDQKWKVYKKVYGGKKIPPKSLLDKEQVGGTSHGKKEIETLFGNLGVFDNPKPVDLVKEMIRFSSKDDDIILDSFAGSGTTGHAVLDLNKEDGGNRKFILVEMEDHVAKDITAERIKRAINKYDYDAGFEYCELSHTLFDSKGQINKECTHKQLASYVFFTETQTNIDLQKVQDVYIGSKDNTHYHLIFTKPGVNTLNKSRIKQMKLGEGSHVIYADKCLVDEETLEKHNIEFKQIPYEVNIY